MKKILILLITLFCRHAFFAQAGSDTTVVAPAPPVLPPPTTPKPDFLTLLMKLLQDSNTLTSWFLLLFGFFLLRMLINSPLLQRQNSEQHVKIITMVLVVFASLFLISAGWDPQQTAPAFGVLGTLLGYLLGKNSSNNRPDDPPAS